MKKLIVFLFFLITQINFAQGAEYNDVYPPDVILPKFNDGGLEKFYDYINKNFDFSKATKSGKMITSFTINELGEIKNIRVVQFVDIESATEIIRVLKNAPKWQPATQNGKPYSVAIKFPLEFKEKEPTKIVATKKDDDDLVNEKNDNGEVLSIAGLDVKPEYPSGMNEFYKLIRDNFIPPDVPGLKGKIIIQFVVEKDGTLTDFKILKDIGHGCGDEAIRVLKKSTLWKPAEQNGKLVRCAFIIPISIEVPK